MKSRTGLNRTCLTFCNLKFLQQVYEKSDKFESNVSDFCTMCSRPVSNMFTKHVQLFCQYQTCLWPVSKWLASNMFMKVMVGQYETCSSCG
uniref:Uncharacterized protein n=1 Tax=Spodoptera littoralis nuclear polyhedrosis virus TaxID=10456 RepID=A0A3G4S936_NPVSL|nr:hypothetical protein [Spodoptera littoralis nucleopolyhedrovirus]